MKLRIGTEDGDESTVPSPERGQKGDHPIQPHLKPPVCYPLFSQVLVFYDGHKPGELTTLGEGWISVTTLLPYRDIE